MHESGRTIEIDGARIHTQARGTPGGPWCASSGASLGLFPFGSHIVHQQQPSLVTPYIRDFLRRLDQPPK